MVKTRTVRDAGPLWAIFAWVWGWIALGVDMGVALLILWGFQSQGAGALQLGNWFVLICMAGVVANLWHIWQMARWVVRRVRPAIAWLRARAAPKGAVTVGCVRCAAELPTQARFCGQCGGAVALGGS